MSDTTTFKKFSFTPDNIFQDSNAFPNPASGEAAREQFTRPLKQMETYVNDYLVQAVQDVQKGIEDINASGTSGGSSIPITWINDNIN